MKFTCFWLDKVELTKSQIYALKTAKTMLYNEEQICNEMLNLP